MRYLLISAVILSAALALLGCGNKPKSETRQQLAVPSPGFVVGVQPGPSNEPQLRIANDDTRYQQILRRWDVLQDPPIFPSGQVAAILFSGWANQTIRVTTLAWQGQTLKLGGETSACPPHPAAAQLAAGQIQVFYLPRPQGGAAQEQGQVSLRRLPCTDPVPAVSESRHQPRAGDG